MNNLFKRIQKNVSLLSRKWLIIIICFLLAITSIFLFIPFAFSNFSCFINNEFRTIQFESSTSILTQISLILIGICVTVFVLAVTLLGNAAKIAKEKKDVKEQENKNEFSKSISALEEKLKKNPQDTEGLKREIDELEVKKTYTENEIRKIESKYQSLNLKNSVIAPSILFIYSLIIGNLFLPLFNNQIFQASAFLIALVFIIIGISKMITTLKTIQEVALDADDDRTSQLEKSLINALKTVNEEKEPRPYLTFKEKPPFVLKNNTEYKIDFEIELATPGSSEAKNVDVWFLFSPEIEIIESPKYTKPFKQSASYSIPNANTTRFKEDIVKRHTRAHGFIKIKCVTTGEYKLRYKIDCDNHVEPATKDKEIGIIVQ